MEVRYSRNRIYISKEEQEMIKDFPILLGGSGIGSAIAECALRLGFEKITIIDGDEVETSNLNRQNYTANDVGTMKTEAIMKRLKSINSNADIVHHNCFLTPENVHEFIKGHKAAINALDFTSEVPLMFDKICQEENITVLHPYNLGWAGLVTVIAPDSFSLDIIAKKGERFNELNMVEYASSFMKFWGNPQDWIDDVIREFKNEEEPLPPPQLSVASSLVAGMCTHILFNLVTGREVKKFPDFYLTSLLNQ
ncbi:ThiF family adenylyltransferase [Tenacibaculum xiamenense]|uniref:ThiF family adenylyltransferase n=1 Tax=Tenacibaculum xiamenense TaxID=1261553 RepID=UPI0038956427